MRRPGGVDLRAVRRDPAGHIRPGWGVMLRQIPGVFELIGLVLVSVAVWLASRE